MSKFLAATILITLFISGCKKNDTLSTQSTPNIKEILFKPPGFPNGSNRVDFYYDNANRVTNISIINLANAFIDTLCTIDFNYLSTDKLPYMALRNDRLNVNVSRHYYYYNFQNTLLKDSTIIQSCCTKVFNYNYSGNYTISKSLNGTELTIDTIYSINNNIVLFSTTRNNTSLLSSSIEYDNHINPLYNLNIVPVIQTVCLDRNPLQPYWPIWSFSNKTILLNIYGNSLVKILS